MSGFVIMWLYKEEDNPHSQVKKRKTANVWMQQAQFSLEPSSASNDNVGGLRLQRICYGHAALKYVGIYLYLRGYVFPSVPFVGGHYSSYTFM